MTDEPRLDLSALDPEADPTRLERSASAIAARLAPAMRRRRERAPLLWLQIAGWRRPVLAFAALVAVASITVLVRPRPGAATGPGAGPLTLEEAEGVPAPVATWLETGQLGEQPAWSGTQEQP